MRKGALPCAAAVTFALAAVLITPAGATYRGANGRIAFTEQGARVVELYSVRPDGTDKRRLTTNASTEASPAYSPDGRRIAFASDRARRGVYEIWSMNDDGTGLRRVTRMGGKAISPDFSPNGRRILFAGYRRGGKNTDLFVVGANGAGLVRLTKGRGNDGQPVWSPDGKRIAFVSDRTGIAHVYVMRADGTRRRQVTSTRVAHIGVDWSPDGRRLVYDEGNPGEPASIWVMNADESAKRRLTRAPGVIRDFGPVWSPDGRQIAFVRLFAHTRDARESVFVMNADGSGQRALNASGQQRVPAWQPLIRSASRG
jgi:TolB protein